MKNNKINETCSDIKLDMLKKAPEEHCRYFRIADITIRVESDLPITGTTFHPKFKLFEVDAPGEDTINIKHHFSLPDLNGKGLGMEVYRKLPWAIYKKKDSWIYLGISSVKNNQNLHRVAVFNSDHTSGFIYGSSGFRVGEFEHF